MTLIFSFNLDIIKDGLLINLSVLELSISVFVNYV